MKRALGYFKKYIRQKKLRLTKQREEITKMFLAKEGHVCVDELYDAIKKQDSKIGYTTVYRTLKLLKEANMAAEVNFTGKKGCFEHAYEHPHHDHFICTSCGCVIEFVDPEIEHKQLKLCQRYKFKRERHQLQILGLCYKCQKKRG